MNFVELTAALVIDTGRPIAHVARELEVYESSLGRWVTKERAARGEDDQPLDADDRAELEALKRDPRRADRLTPDRIAPVSGSRGETQPDCP